MDRQQALPILQKLIGTDLRALAARLGVRLSGVSGANNKGWAGHTLERYLGLPLNSAQAPDFGTWELKQVSLRRRSGVLGVKETMAITMIDAHEVSAKPFEQSHLYSKLKSTIVVARVWESPQEEHSIIHSVATFDLNNPAMLAQVKADYEAVRAILKTGTIDNLSGTMGILVQPRTKGPGGSGPKTRAFYARTKFVAHILNIAPLHLPGYVSSASTPEAP